MSKNIHQPFYSIQRAQREFQKGHQAKVIWFTGLSGSGKSTMANLLDQALFELGIHTYVLDGDNLRSGLNRDLNFSQADRKENLRRMAEVAKLFLDAGIVVLAAFITPFEEDREKIKKMIGTQHFIQIYVECPLEVCEQRDVKGLYAKVRKGEISNFTGIDSPFDIPQNNDLIINSAKEEKEVGLHRILDFVLPQLKLS